MGMRFICRETDCAAAANVGGPVNTTFRTFVTADSVETWLRLDSGRYVTRECIGVELVDTQQERS